MTVRDWDADHRPAPKVPRRELKALATIEDADQRLYLTLYLNGAQESDQQEAQRRCVIFGVDYEMALKELRGAT